MVLVERGDALTVLRGAMRGAARGTGTCVITAGEAGIGKTSLLRAFARELDDADVWWGECVPLETPHPLAPLYDIARVRCPRLRPLLAAGDRAALFDGVLAALHARGRPTLLVIEDAHWADDATLDLITFAGRRIDGVPCVLVVSYRDDETSPSHPLGRVLGALPARAVERLDLAALSRTAVDALARAALRSPEGLYAATRGNPLFVTEMLRHNGPDVPRSVRDMVLSRFGRLSEESRLVVQLASIVPPRIEYALLDRLAEPSAATIEACMNAGLLVDDGDGYAFRHDLVRGAIASSIPGAAVRSLHARVLGALPALPSVPPARLAHHAVRAQDADAIRRYVPDAAEAARRDGSHREAAAHFRALVDHAAAADDGERAAWLEGLAHESRVIGDLARAESARIALDALYRRAGDTAAAALNLSALALVQIHALRDADAHAASETAVAMTAGLADSAGLAEVHRVRGHLQMLDRDCAGALASCAEAERIATRCGAVDALRSIRSTLGAAQLFVDYAAGRALLLNALDDARAANDRSAIALILVNLGSGSGEVFRLREAASDLREAIAFSERHEIDAYRWYATAWLALVEMYAGRWDDAVRGASDVLAGSDARGITRLTALVAFARCRIRRGDGPADDLLDEALDLAEASRTLQRVAPVRAARAEAAFARGDLDTVAREAREALDLAVARGHRWFAGELAAWLHRAGSLATAPALCAEPYALEIAGRTREAAAAWDAIGAPYERDRLLAHAAPAHDAHGLTVREREVLAFMCDGLKNAEIAQRLSRSVRTVDHHVAATLAKLGASTRAEAVATALRTGLV